MSDISRSVSKAAGNALSGATNYFRDTLSYISGGLFGSSKETATNPYVDLTAVRDISTTKEAQAVQAEILTEAQNIIDAKNAEVASRGQAGSETVAPTINKDDIELSVTVRDTNGNPIATSNGKRSIELTPKQAAIADKVTVAYNARNAVSALSHGDLSNKVGGTSGQHDVSLRGLSNTVVGVTAKDEYGNQAAKFVDVTIAGMDAAKQAAHLEAKNTVTVDVSQNKSRRGDPEKLSSEQLNNNFRNLLPHTMESVVDFYEAFNALPSAFIADYMSAFGSNDKLPATIGPIDYYNGVLSQEQREQYELNSAHGVPSEIAITSEQAGHLLGATGELYQYDVNNLTTEEINRTIKGSNPIPDYVSVSNLPFSYRQDFVESYQRGLPVSDDLEEFMMDHFALSLTQEQRDYYYAVDRNGGENMDRYGAGSFGPEWGFSDMLPEYP